MDKNTTQTKFHIGNKKKFEVEQVEDSAVYARESAGRFPRLHNLILWKTYCKEENTWKPVFAMQHLQKYISIFHKDYSEKLIVTLFLVNTAPSKTRPTTRV